MHGSGGRGAGSRSGGKGKGRLSCLGGVRRKGWTEGGDWDRRGEQKPPDGGKEIRGFELPGGEGGGGKGGQRGGIGPEGGGGGGGE